MRLRTKLIAAAALAALAAGLVGPASAADDYTVKDSTGATITIRAKEVAAKKYTTHTVADSAGTIVDPATAPKQDTGNASLASIDGKIVAPRSGTITVTITRPADTTPYTANDAWANSTSAPTAGGFVLTGVCPADGRSVMFDSVTVISSNDPTTLLQGELWIADGTLTAVNDNAAFALSDTDAVKMVPTIPFALSTTQNGSGANSMYGTGGLSIGYTCANATDPHFLVKVKNGYTPASGEQLTVRLHYVGL